MLTRAYHHALNSSTIAAGEPVLDIVDIGLHFGGVTALKDVGFRVTQGHIHSVIGPTVRASRACSTASVGSTTRRRAASICTRPPAHTS